MSAQHEHTHKEAQSHDESRIAKVSSKNAQSFPTAHIWKKCIVSVIVTMALYYRLDNAFVYNAPPTLSYYECVLRSYR